jgi:hypothetical protein
MATKNVITRAWLEKELAKDNRLDVRGGRNFFLGISLFALLFFGFVTCVIAFNIYNTVGRVITFAVGGALILFLSYFSSLPLRWALRSRRRIARGDFLVITRELYSKSIETDERHTYIENHYLHFGKNGSVLVSASEYLLADKGTEYYLVCYTEHGSILRYFSTKAYEYRENGTDAFSE